MKSRGSAHAEEAGNGSLGAGGLVAASLRLDEEPTYVPSVTPPSSFSVTQQETGVQKQVLMSE